ncbi:MAG: hypothetical protein IPN20_23530 [Haliscomenobacter sp.]|nr:hypothetical protein [Haliscomenobacter sp.]
MSKIKIDIISPTHVGSGMQFQGNSEYLFFGEGKTLVIAEELKILNIIGIDNLHVWVNFIEERQQNFLVTFFSVSQISGLLM